jgi:hypothetical protein
LTVERDGQGQHLIESMLPLSSHQQLSSANPRKDTTNLNSKHPTAADFWPSPVNRQLSTIESRDRDSLSGPP